MSFKYLLIFRFSSPFLLFAYNLSDEEPVVSTVWTRPMHIHGATGLMHAHGATQHVPLSSAFPANGQLAPEMKVFKSSLLSAYLTLKWK